MIVVVMNRKLRIDRRLLLVIPVSLVITGLMLALSGFGTVSIIVLILPAYVLLWLTTKPLSYRLARIRYSIRWKFEIAIAGLAALFLVVALISFGAMDKMHDGLHDIQDLMDTQKASQSLSTGAWTAHSRSQVRTAVEDLEDSRHGILFTLIPVFGLLGVLGAAALGTSMAWSVIEPLRKMRETMSGIASGRFSERIEVENNDELGELADHINATAAQLARLQEATLKDERARAVRERVAHVAQAEEEERRRISRELHDGLGPSLAAIGNRIRVSRGMVRTDPATAETHLDEIAEGLKGHIREIRELIYDLRPLALDQLGLTGALQQHVERFGQETGIQASFRASGEVSLDALGEMTVFRVVQECLNNVQEHAEAAQVEVSVRTVEELVEVMVEDNGRGFDPNETSPSGLGKGVGLFSMRERAELIGGSVTLQSAPGSGCVATLRLPSHASASIPEFAEQVTPVPGGSISVLSIALAHVCARNPGHEHTAPKTSQQG